MLSFGREYVCEEVKKGEKQRRRQRIARVKHASVNGKYMKELEMRNVHGVQCLLSRDIANETEDGSR